MTDILTDTNFEILYTDGAARIGNIKTTHGNLKTPTFFPVHNLGGDAGWNTPRYWEIFPDMQTAMFNGYSILLNKKRVMEKIALSGGVHDFLGFQGIAFVDSGGYIGKENPLNVSQESILKIQEDIGADIASTLDLPFNMNEDFDLYNKIYQSFINAVQARRKLANRDMLLYASVHGNDPLVLKNVLIFLSKNETFDGFAIGSLVPIRNDFRRVVDMVLSARSVVRNKPLHVFGLGGFLTVPLLVYLGVDSSDSSSFIICGGKRRYFVPSYREISMASLEDYGDLPCNCPICSSKTYEEVRADRSLIALHNLWVLWNELKMVKYAISEGRLEKYLENRYAETPILKSAFEYAKMKRRNFL